METIRHLWQADPDLQVVVCTAYADYTWTDMVSELGRTRPVLILKKPFDAIEVCQLATALTEKWTLTRERARFADGLAQEVEERTRELALINEELRAEMAARLATEKDLRHAQKLEALGRLTASIGHASTTPCPTSSSTSATSSKSSRGSSSPRSRNASWTSARRSRMRSAASSATKSLVQGIKAFARPDENSVGAANAREAIDGAVRMVRAELVQRAELVLSVDDSPSSRDRRCQAARASPHERTAERRSGAPGGPGGEPEIGLRLRRGERATRA